MPGFERVSAGVACHRNCVSEADLVRDTRPEVIVAESTRLRGELDRLMANIRAA